MERSHDMIEYRTHEILGDGTPWNEQIDRFLNLKAAEGWRLAAFDQRPNTLAALIILERGGNHHLSDITQRLLHASQRLEAYAGGRDR